jgi:eukaryotic-like serine/threonine-protein kinase
MKVCPTCQNQYPDDANFCPREECAGVDGPQKLKRPPGEPPPRFTLVARIGGSTSGETWQANDAESGAAVAYKKVAEGVFQSALIKERCLRELKQLQRATSPRIARIVEAGRALDGSLFVASELVAGDPVDEVVRGAGPLPLDRAKRIVAQIGEALLDAQKVGLVHRELGPKNVLLGPGDSVKVINFAVPRPLAEQPLGVAEFMSPEQAEGKLVDQRSNTYGLGAILYFLLTGSPPVSGGSLPEIVEGITRGEVSPPSIRWGGGLTAEVDRVVLKALDKSSSRRPLTLRQFLAEVAGLVVTDEQQILATTSQAHSKGHDAGPEPAHDPAFKRTMMFAGGAAEVQKLVAEAAAARPSDAEASGVRVEGGIAPVPAEAGSTRSAAVAVIRAPGSGPIAVARANGRGDEKLARPSPAASAATAAAPPPPASSSGSTPGPTPAPSVLFPMVAPAEAEAREVSSSQAAGAKTGDTQPGAGAERPAAEGAPPAAGGFRETLWFKKGDVDQMVADARAKMAEKVAKAAAEKAAETMAAEAAAAQLTPEIPTGAFPTGDSGPTGAAEVKPLEDRYVDDGTVTVDDRKKFSLRRGESSSGHSVRVAAVPGERMTETEVLDEIGGGKRSLLVAFAVIVVGLVAAGAVWKMTRRSDDSSGKGQAASPPAESAKALPEPTPASPPPAVLSPTQTVPTATRPAAEEPPAASGNPEPAAGAAPAPAPAAATAASPAPTAEPAQVEPSSSRAAARKKAAAAKKKPATVSKKTLDKLKQRR